MWGAGCIARMLYASECGIIFIDSFAMQLPAAHAADAQPINRKHIG